MHINKYTVFPRDKSIVAFPTIIPKVPRGVESKAQQRLNQGTLPPVKAQFTPGEDDVPVHYINPGPIQGGSNIKDPGDSGGVQSYWNPREGTVISYLKVANFAGEAAVYLGGVYQGKVNVASGVLTMVKIRLKTLGGTCGGVEAMKVVLVDQEGWQLEEDAATAAHKFKTVCVGDSEDRGGALDGKESQGGIQHRQGGISEEVNGLRDEERASVFTRIYENNEWQVCVYVCVFMCVYVCILCARGRMCLRASMRIMSGRCVCVCMYVLSCIHGF
jgi:hypothetical protein